MWECLHCGESVEDVFDVCWRCQANRDGTPSGLNDPPRDAGEEEEIAFLNKRYVPRDCLRCRAAMKHAGEKGLREGSNWGGFGGELFIRRLKLDMYVCPRCLHVEFFAAEPFS
jgi:hypothetical protein